MFIIDFDDTLFDTHAYKQARLQSLLSLGVSEELFWKTYKEARHNKLGFSTYSDKRHAQVLAENGFDEEKVLFAFEMVNDKLKDFLFTDTISFLEQIKKQGQPMILLSLGESKEQEKKVHGTGVHTYFDRMFMVQDTKEHVVRELMQHFQKENPWFVNDKVQETVQVMEKFPLLRPVLHQSPAIPVQEYISSGFPYFQTLTEILKYVESN